MADDFFEDAEGEILTPMTEGFLENKEQSVNFLRPIIMGRIVHLENWLKIMPVLGKTFSLVMKVEDRWIEANNGIWLWEAGNGSVELCRTERKPDIQLGIDALIQWLTGYWSFDELEDSGRISVWTDCRDALRDISVTGKILINEIV